MDTAQEQPSLGSWPAWRASLRLPAVFVVVSLALIGISWASINWLRDQTWPITFFAIGALIIFHLVAWAGSRISDERTYKIVDYIFLALSLSGLFAIFGAQTDYTKDYFGSAGKMYEFLLKKERCQDPDSRRCKNYLEQQAMLDEAKDDPYAIRGWISLYYKQTAPMVGRRTEDLSPTDRVLLDDAERFAIKMGDLDRRLALFQFKSAFQRLLPFYVLAIAVAIRATKVTAELFKWYQTEVLDGATSSPF